MHTFFATTGRLAQMGSLQQCLNWANGQIENNKAKVVKILKARPGEPDVMIIGEVTKAGRFRTPGGRSINLSRLKKALKYGEEEIS